MINVLIVDDSATTVQFLKGILTSDPEIRIVGVAKNGIEAIEAVQKYKPDVITMDIIMPKMDGIEATRQIMEIAPTPIVIVSGNINVHEISNSFKILDAGALALVQRPVGYNHPEMQQMFDDLIRTVKLMSEIKVVKRWAKDKIKQISEIPEIQKGIQQIASEIKIIAIGASTGGTNAIKEILSELPKDFDVPILIVQHISPGFVGGFTDWLDSTVNITVKIAEDGEIPQSGFAYVAQDNFHLELDNDKKISLSIDKPEEGAKPSVSHLFHSVSDAYGKNAVGVLLTGMGKDGAYGLKYMKDNGALTFVQSEASCIVFGMPGAAILLDAHTFVLSPKEIANEIIRFCEKGKNDEK